MAASLRVELDDPRKVYKPEDLVAGVVIVRCEGTFNCKSLEVRTCWATHGRGNVDSAVIATENLFSGNWEAGREERYRFELKAGDWPPTYHGQLLNVSHKVEARAQLAWKLDLKTAVEYFFTHPQSPEDLKPVRPEASWGAKVGLGLLAAVFLIPLIVLIGLLVIPLLLIAAGIWFFQSFLPKRAIGPVQATLELDRVRAGETVRGRLLFTPPRELAVNFISSEVVCSEVCVSGSGSNRRTHRQRVFEQKVLLYDTPTRLPAGTMVDLPVQFDLPATAPPSMKLSDNSVEWEVLFEVDLPRWPNFKQKRELRVAPADPDLLTADILAGDQAELEEDEFESGEDFDSAEDLVAAEEAPADLQWLDETVEQLRAVAGDPRQLRMVIEAVAVDCFPVSLDITGELAEPPRYDTHLPRGVWRSADSLRRDRRYYVVFDRASDAPPLFSRWRGHIKLLGYLSDERAVIAQAVEPPAA